MTQNAIVLDKQNNFVTKYGTTLNEKYPSVLFLRTKSKITPILKKKEYDAEINLVKDSFTTFVKDAILGCKSVEDTYIFNIDISSKGVKYGKTSFLRYDLYVRPTKRTTIEENKFGMQQLSKKLDIHLEQLLNNNGILCK
jgi:hypothetical protein